MSITLQALAATASAVIALIALFRPEISRAFRRSTNDVELTLTPRLEVGFGSFGPTINVLGSLRAVGHDQFVSAITLTVVRAGRSSTPGIRVGGAPTAIAFPTPGNSRDRCRLLSFSRERSSLQRAVPRSDGSRAGGCRDRYCSRGIPRFPAEQQDLAARHTSAGAVGSIRAFWA